MVSVNKWLDINFYPETQEKHQQISSLKGGQFSLLTMMTT